jgi:hypothetical protein
MRLMAASGQNRSSRQPCNARLLLPARGAGLSGLGVRAGTSQQKPALPARHGRRESARRRMRRPGATRGFAQPGHEQDHHQLWLPFGSPASLAPLTFSKTNGGLKLATAPANGPRWPRLRGAQSRAGEVFALAPWPVRRQGTAQRRFAAAETARASGSASRDSSVSPQTELRNPRPGEVVSSARPAPIPQRV